MPGHNLGSVQMSSRQRNLTSDIIGTAELRLVTANYSGHSRAPTYSGRKEKRRNTHVMESTLRYEYAAFISWHLKHPNSFPLHDKASSTSILYSAFMRSSPRIPLQIDSMHPPIIRSSPMMDQAEHSRAAPSTDGRIS